jgi:hypothetical protein
MKGCASISVFARGGCKNVGLLAPWFLAGLLAVGIPVWLHLLKRSKTTPLRFSSLMFFERRTQSSVRHRRLDYLLLFALRALFVALLALLFAEPYLMRSAERAAESNRVVVAAIDNSLSMRVGNRLDTAKAEAAQLVGGLRASQRGQVIAFGSQVQVLSQPVNNPAELRAAVEAVQPSDSRSSYGELARSLRQLESTLNAPLDVHIYTDLQATSMPPGFADLQTGASTRITLHPVSSQVEPNWAVESVTSAKRLYGARKATVDVTLAGHHAPKATRTVTLLVNGQALATKQAEVPEANRATVTFSDIEVPYGFNRGEARIEGGDALAADDRYLFAVERSDPSRVLFVQDGRDSRAQLYFQVALESGSQGAFAIDAVSGAQAATMPLAKYAFVVLSDPAPLSTSFAGDLETYVRRGGSLWVALGTNASAMPRVPVAGLAILERRFATREGERFQSAMDVDATHPAVGRADRFDGVRFYRALSVSADDARVLARLADKTPLLIERRVGEGKVLVFTSTFDNVSNDFPLRPSFVAFVEQAAQYLSGSEGRQQPVFVDAFVDLRAEEGRGEAVEVIGPDGKRELSLGEAASARTFQPQREGFYEIRRGQGRQELVAVNADRRESDLAMVSEETRQLWEKVGQAEESQQAAGAAGAARKPYPLWRYLLLALLVLGVTVPMVASRYVEQRREAV